MHTYIKYLAATLLIFALSLPSNAKDKNKKKVKHTLTAEQLSKVTVLLLDAEKAKLIEDFPAAIAKYNEILDIDKKNDNAYYQLAALHFATNKLNDAEFEAEQAVKLNAENKWYWELLAKIQMKSDNLKSSY
jgi:tetratricopeptide (TPR) repeat protein